MSSKYTFRVVTANRPNTEETGDFNGSPCGEHKTFAAAEKRIGRLVAMSRGNRNRSHFAIEQI